MTGPDAPKSLVIGWQVPNPDKLQDSPEYWHMDKEKGIVRAAN